MAGTTEITKIEVEGFSWDVVGMTTGRAAHYDADSTFTRYAGAIRIHADNGVVGEYAGWLRDPNAVAETAR